MNWPSSAEGSSGLQAGAMRRYDDESPASSPTRTSATRRPAVGPSRRLVAESSSGYSPATRRRTCAMAPAWRPELPSAELGQFTMVDLLRFAGVA